MADHLDQVLLLVTDISECAFGVFNSKTNLPNYHRSPELVLSPLPAECISLSFYSDAEDYQITHLRETALPSFSLPSWNASSTVFMGADDELIGGCG